MSNFDFSRFKNYGFWIALAALIPLVLNVFGVEIVPEEYEALVNALLAVLVAAGIVNNPTTEKKGFGDDVITEEIEDKEK